MNQQLALSIQLNDEATLDDFCWGENILLQQQLAQTIQGEEPRIVYLWGEKGCGKSHLLQACCHASSLDRPAIYLPLLTLKEWGPSILDDLETQALLCIDDLDTIAGDKSWEESLFHLFNRIKDNENTCLIFASQYSPRQIPIVLPDLKSRLSWALIAHLETLSDEDKISTLYLRAQKRGFELPLSVAQFLVNRSKRSMHDLQELLDKLDKASLIAQRKITIPFVKQWLCL